MWVYLEKNHQEWEEGITIGTWIWHNSYWDVMGLERMDLEVLNMYVYLLHGWEKGGINGKDTRLVSLKDKKLI